MTNKAKKPQIDWKVIERDYRAGIKSLEQIGQEQGVTKGRISQVAKRDQWTRDLNKRIQAKADARVNEAAVNKALNKESDRLAERVVVEANADLQYRVRMEHRAGLLRLRVVKDKVLAHLESVVDNLEDLSDVIAMVRNPDESGQDRANDKLRRAMERSAVCDDLKKLAEIDEKVRKGEREAFGIDSQPDGDVQSLEAKFMAIIKAQELHG